MTALDGKVVLVTGATGGIGQAVARACAKAQAQVIVHFHRQEEKAARLVDDIRRAGGRARAVQADIGDARGARKLAEDVVSAEGRIDALVNNAAVARDHTIVKMEEKEWDEVIATDLSGAFFLLKTAAAAMARRRDGAIINIASIAAFRGSFGAANYASAKAGLIALTKSSARELGRFNIRVNAVLPGFHLTGMSAGLPGEYRRKALEDSVLGTTTDLQELAQFIVFLLALKTVSGQVFNLDSRLL